MKIKLQWLTFRLFLLRITAHEHSAQWLQLFWAAVEKILNEVLGVRRDARPCVPTVTYMRLVPERS